MNAVCNINPEGWELTVICMGIIVLKKVKKNYNGF
jgi:hypothetical protein